jgi:hypothetical protein
MAVAVLQQGNFPKLKLLPNFQSRLKTFFGIYKTLTTSFNFLFFAPHNFDLKYRH